MVQAAAAVPPPFWPSGLLEPAADYATRQSLFKHLQTLAWREDFSAVSYLPITYFWWGCGFFTGSHTKFLPFERTRSSDQIFSEFHSGFQVIFQGYQTGVQHYEIF
jgi:hypothetical protein